MRYLFELAKKNKKMGMRKYYLSGFSVYGAKAYQG